MKNSKFREVVATQTKPLTEFIQGQGRDVGLVGILTNQTPLVVTDQNQRELSNPLNLGDKQRLLILSLDVARHLLIELREAIEQAESGDFDPFERTH